MDEDRQQNEERQRYAIYAEIFSALANTTRQELMHDLCDGPRTPSELADLLGISRPNVSQQLAVLQRAGLVRRERRGDRVYWSVIDPRLKQACALFDEIVGREFSARAHALGRETSDGGSSANGGPPPKGTADGHAALGEAVRKASAPTTASEVTAPDAAPEATAATEEEEL
jgi:DNA-binding transcriptional ArsR family regulator